MQILPLPRLVCLPFPTFPQACLLVTFRDQVLAPGGRPLGNTFRAPTGLGRGQAILGYTEGQAVSEGFQDTCTL